MALSVPQTLIAELIKRSLIDRSLVTEIEDSAIKENKDFETWNPFFNKIQEIRNNAAWRNSAGWLSESPQAALEYYNPMMFSKMFMLNDASIWNPFNTEYFFWLDAGITNTVPHSHLTENNILDKLHDKRMSLFGPSSDEIKQITKIVPSERKSPESFSRNPIAMA